MMTAQQRQIAAEQQTYRGGWHTCDEIDFLRGLLNANPEAFFRYAGLVMDGQRSYDDTVEVQRVLRAIDQLMLVANARRAS